MQLEGSDKITSPSNTNQQSTISKQKHGQVHSLAKIKLSSHLWNSSLRFAPQQTQMNMAQTTKSIAQNLRSVESLHLWRYTAQSHTNLRAGGYEYIH